MKNVSTYLIIILLTHSFIVTYGQDSMIYKHHRFHDISFTNDTILPLRMLDPDPIKKRSPVPVEETTVTDTIPLKDTVSLSGSSIDSISIKDTIPGEADTLTIIAVGDIMLGTHFPSKRYLPPGNDCSVLLYPAIDILREADVTFGNLEGSFLNEGPVVKRCKDTLACYAFKMPEEYVSCLKEAGFDALSVANNHIWDFGYKGVSTTIRLLEENSIHFAGLLTHPADTFTRNGAKIGICAFAPNRGTCNINDLKYAQRLVQQLDSLCDIVIVSFHGGAEGAKYQHVTRETESFYGENRGNVFTFAHQMIDAGADLVFGNGPHVPRAIDIYKQKFIAYSLGNFCTYARFNLQGANGIAPLIKISTDRKGNFLSGQIFSFVQKGEGGVSTDIQNRAIHKIKELTFSDFPEHIGKLIITEDGEIFYLTKDETESY